MWHWHPGHYGFHCFGFPGFGFHFRGMAPFPRREEYLRLLEEYKQSLERELRQVEREIEELKR